MTSSRNETVGLASLAAAQADRTSAKDAMILSCVPPRPIFQHRLSERMKTIQEPHLPAMAVFRVIFYTVSPQPWL
jgi:hypothetical protein